MSVPEIGTLPVSVQLRELFYSNGANEHGFTELVTKKKKKHEYE